MTQDDWTSGTGEHWLAGRPLLDKRPSDQVGDELDPVLGITEKDLQLLDSYFHELGVVASEDPRPNPPEDQEADDALFLRMRRTMSMTPAEARAARKRRRAPP